MRKRLLLLATVIACAVACGRQSAEPAAATPTPIPSTPTPSPTMAEEPWLKDPPLEVRIAVARSRIHACDQFDYRPLRGGPAPYEIKCSRYDRIYHVTPATGAVDLVDSGSWSASMAAGGASTGKTRADQSVYNTNILAARTSNGLSNADLAWHALNTYGWDCAEVVAREPQTGDHYIITCSSGKKLRVYPRPNQHPRITNESGGYN